MPGRHQDFFMGNPPMASGLPRRVTSRWRVRVRRNARWSAVLAFTMFLSGCGARSPADTTPGAPSTRALEVREGIATYYGQAFHGKTTASGARFDMHAMVAAHPNYPFGTRVRVTNLDNGRTVSVQILDRGPVARIQAGGVIIDVSQGAAERLGFVREGRARVQVEVLQWGQP